MKKMRNDNKGFTLVEMIVVLVILAILAAILVPALLGYIDEAKNSQLELHGKSVYTAAQAVASKMYAKTTGNAIQTNADDKKDFITQVRTISEMNTFGSDTDKTKVKAIIWFKGNKLSGTGVTTSDKHDYFTIAEMVYTEDGGTTAVRLYNGSWETVDKDTVWDSIVAKTTDVNSYNIKFAAADSST